MREYPLQYARTDKNKKSHYNKAKAMPFWPTSGDVFECVNIHFVILEIDVELGYCLCRRMH